MKKLLFVLLLLASSAMAQTDITSLPYTISSSGTYNLTVDDTVTGTAITISANNVVLNLNGHTIGFGTAGNGGDYRGITATNYSNITISGPGTINHVVDDTVAINAARGVYLSSGEYNVVRGVTINMSGYSTCPDATDYGIDGITFRGTGVYMCRAVSCVINQNNAGFYNRVAYPIRGIAIIRELSHAIGSDSLAEYHVWVDSCTIRYRYLGIQAVGSNNGGTNDLGYIWVSNNYVVGDLKNEMTYVGFRIGDGYGIDFASIAAFRCWNNVVTYSRDNCGGYGIFVEGSVNYETYGFWSYMYNNTCTASVGGWNNADGSDNVGHGTALRIRYQARGLKVYDNTFVAYSDNSSSTTYRNGQAIALNIGTDGDVSLSDLHIYRNKFVAIGDATSEAIAWAMADKRSTDDIRFYENYMASNNTIVQLGFDSYQESYITQHDDTLAFVQDSGNTNWTYNMNIGDWGANSPIDSFRSINNVYLGGAFDTNIYIYPNAALIQEMLILYTVTITATGNNSYPVENASVWCVNGLGDTVFTGTTNASGEYTDTVQTWFEEYGNTDNFNNFVLGVAYSGDSTYSASTVSDSTRTFERVLASTEGGVPAPAVTTKKIRGAYIRKGKI